MKWKGVLLAFLGVVFLWGNAQATPTDITVRIKTKDAKFLGSSMGGALITIKNVDTGELLAKGLTSGGTGNTKIIMKTPVSRGSAISDEKSAKFAATIDIDEPTLIQVTAFGPLCQRQAANTVSATQWVVPGKHITEGDAWMMEMPGLVVDILSPPTHIKYKGAKEVLIAVNLTMM